MKCISYKEFDMLNQERNKKLFANFFLNLNYRSSSLLSDRDNSRIFFNLFVFSNESTE